MSVTTVDRSQDVRGAVVYAVYGTASGARDGVIRAAGLSMVGVGEARDDPWAALAWVDEGQEMLRPHTQRSNQAVTIVQSWAVDELDAQDPADIERAQAMGRELATRLAPGSPVVVATHTDSKSGCVHNHIIVLNHDLATGKATSKQAGNWHAVAFENDRLMRDWHMRVLSQSEVSLSQAERTAAREGRNIDSSGLALHEIGPDTWRHYLRARVDEVLADPRVTGASDPEAGWTAAQQIAADHGVSIRVEGGSAVTLALVDDDGEVATYATSRGRTRKAATAGSKLGETYTMTGLGDRIAEAQAAHAARIARQARRDALARITSDRDTEEKDDVTGNTHGDSHRAVPQPGVGPGDGGSGKTDRRPGQPEAEALVSDGGGGAAGREGHRGRGLGGGTDALVRAAAAARRAAAAAQPDDGGDGGVRHGAESGRGDDLVAGDDDLIDGPGVTVGAGHAGRFGADVQSDTGGRGAPRETLRRQHQERLSRIVQANIDEPEI
ncbi:relaxase [Corynebacterium doosanense CAU 212 = DSM 45436]|uniref:Relaxase n=1 Tax=Corynebacterium doosanense CAU 212 = DSM 45436 TaxID=558173 RepID=A0A097IEC0_9CORY|nr:relaxase [Corynebacterium doosanense CAU 212 = DSM 45436]